MSKSTRPPNELESNLHQAALNAPNNELSAKAAESIIADPIQRKDALNYLLAVGLLKPLKNSKGALIFRAVTRSEHSTNVGLSEEEKVVLGYIRGAQNEGIWVKHLKAKTNFHQTILDRCIKTLEQKKLIKKVPSVQHPTRKIYMLEGLVPSVALTGGPWFTDGEFDTEFIETLMKACFKFIRDMSFPKSRGRQQPDRALYPISKAPKYPTAQQVRNALKQARLTETDLTVEHVEILLNVLVLDGEIEKLPAFGSSLWDSGAIDDNDSEDERRSKKKRKHQSSDNENDERSSSRKRNRKARTSDDSDSEDDRSSRRKAKHKRDSDDTNGTSSKGDRRKSKKKRLESDVSDEGSSDQESTHKGNHKSKKSRHASDSSSESDSDSDDTRSHRNKSKSKRSPSPFFSFDEAGSHVYRAIHEERVSLGWSQAPCSGCPSFEFCKSGGPVNPEECVYYGDWLGVGTVAAIEDTK
ncbi:RNA polymerase Rpc34 subunit-domain-containing protein [Lentinula raphanica]|uniref:RNA polymerase Rpc34 subunit-domain-containing protein n=1 Tax=Lentinula raphanica TaxID=153919 RepID=A0AA38PEQ2_9AGAR|nr:RNA polymerase Rpc34 subunit-domain-containing protein [Lentinula raphanica]KAJ3977272.1 RNA polymerase Rpc34 subunit-domain-containing protein [Lentinula raphanica]